MTNAKAISTRKQKKQMLKKQANDKSYIINNVFINSGNYAYNCKDSTLSIDINKDNLLLNEIKTLRAEIQSLKELIAKRGLK